MNTFLLATRTDRQFSLDILNEDSYKYELEHTPLCVWISYSVEFQLNPIWALLCCLFWHIHVSGQCEVWPNRICDETPWPWRRFMTCRLTTAVCHSPFKAVYVVLFLMRPSIFTSKREESVLATGYPHSRFIVNHGATPHIKITKKSQNQSKPGIND